MRASSPTPNAGMTLVEVAMALAVIALSVALVTASLANITTQTTSLRTQTIVASLVRDKLAEMQRQADADISRFFNTYHNVTSTPVYYNAALGRTLTAASPAAELDYAYPRDVRFRTLCWSHEGFTRHDTSFALDDGRRLGMSTGSSTGRDLNMDSDAGDSTDFGGLDLQPFDLKVAPTRIDVTFRDPGTDQTVTQTYYMLFAKQN